MVFLIIWSISYFYIKSFFEFIPAEYRDYAFVGIVDAFKSGENPFSYTYFYDNCNPGVIVDSGVIHIIPIIVSALFFDFNILNGLYVLNYIYVLIVAVIMYKIIKKETDNSLVAVISSIFVITCINRQGILITRPDVFALICQLCMVYLAIQETRKWLHFLVAGVSTWFIVLSKPHYVLVSVAWVLALIIRKKYKDVVKYMISILVTGIVGFILLIRFFPMHIIIWTERVYEMFIGVGNNASSKKSLMYVFSKWLSISKEFFPLLLLFCFLFIITCIEKYKKRKEVRL